MKHTPFFQHRRPLAIITLTLVASILATCLLLRNDETPTRLASESFPPKAAHRLLPTPSPSVQAHPSHTSLSARERRQAVTRLRRLGFAQLRNLNPPSADPSLQSLELTWRWKTVWFQMVHAGGNL